LKNKKETQTWKVNIKACQRLSLNMSEIRPNRLGLGRRIAFWDVVAMLTDSEM